MWPGLPRLLRSSKRRVRGLGKACQGNWDAVCKKLKSGGSPMTPRTQVTPHVRISAWKTDPQGHWGNPEEKQVTTLGQRRPFGAR